jgi:hypothetical protein
MLSRATLATLSLLALGWGNLAWADGTIMPGTRALGVGGALRGAATGDSGPMLNPSGISLIRAYVVEGAYQYGSQDSAQAAHVSVVDSTSAFNIGGALTYTFHHAKPGSNASQTTHLLGGSLSFPIGDIVFLGGSAKYLYWHDDNPSVETKTKAVIFDAGLTIRPLPLFSLGFVGYNLSNRENNFVPMGFGGGVSVNLIPGLSLLFDSVYEQVYNDPSRAKTYWIMGGAEYNSQAVAVRLGGGRDGVTKNGYLSAGASLVSQVGALEIAVRQDVSGDGKSTFIGVSGRLFVPAP